MPATVKDFRISLEKSLPPEGIAPALNALWYDGKGDWNKAHDIAQETHSTDGSWIHAYLHRKEGDDGNAAYWYSKAGKKFPANTLEQEWEEIVAALLKK
jgi:hypothetical protein